MKKHLLWWLSALLVFMPLFVIGADWRWQGHEMSSSKWISNVWCTSVINSSSCDYTWPVKSLRKWYEYEFSDEFWAWSQDRRMKNFCAQFKEQSEYGDFNRWTNPNFKWTSDIANNWYWVNKNSSIVVIKADKLYQIKDVPDSRSEDNLFIKYVIEYANNEAATTRYHHTECFPYEISRCWDGVVDEDWFKKDPNDPAEECDYNDPNKAWWKDWSGKTCSKSCKLVDIVPACSSTYNGKTQYTSSANLWLKSTDNLCDEWEVVDFSYTGSPRTYTWNCKNWSKKTDSSCTAKQERCWDGTINGNEDCDDWEKNGTNTSSCSTKCTIVGGASCGTKNGWSTYFDSKQTTSWLSKATEWLCPDWLTVWTPIITWLDSHVEWTCSNTNWAEKICKAYQEYCWDWVKNWDEECDWVEFCDLQCNTITPSTWCDQVFTWHLRFWVNKPFTDNFKAGWLDRYLFYYDVDFKENHWDYNNGSNPTFSWTSQFMSNWKLVPANESMPVIESTPYHIVSTPITRAWDNIYIEYTIWYDNANHTTTPSKSNLHSHKECVYYEISWCWDGIIDTEYWEICDPEAPEWKNGNNWKTCNPVTCEPETVPTKGELDIDKTLVWSWLVNKTWDIVTWNIKVTARWWDVTDFIVTDKLPEVLEYSSYSVVHNPWGLTVLDPVLSWNQVIWSVNWTLKDWDYLTIQLKTKAKWMPKVDYKNVACVRPADDPNWDDCDEEEVKLWGLKVEKTLIWPKEIKEVWDIVQWTLKVTAEWWSVKNPVIQDKMPDVLWFTWYSVVRNGWLSISEPTISWNLVTWKTSWVLADWDYIEIRVDTYAKVMPEKEEKNVLCAWPEDKPEDEKCDNEPVHSPNLWIKKAFRDWSKEKTVKVWDIIAYKIDFWNKWNAAATITSIKDFLPKNVEYVSSEIYIISWSNSHLLSWSEVVGWWTTVEGVYVDVYGWMTLNPNTEWYIILTWKILWDYTWSTQNWACIYLNDKKIDCDWAKHNFTWDNPWGDIMCKAPILSKTSDEICVWSPVEWSTSVTCNSDWWVAKNIEILCDGVVTHSWQNVSSLNWACAFSGAGAHTVKCSVDWVTKDASWNECKWTYTLSTKSCWWWNGWTSCKLEDVKDTNNKYIKDVECRTDNGTKRTIVIDCGFNAKQRYLTWENVSVYTGKCEYSDTWTKTIQCRIYTSNGSQLWGTCQKTTSIQWPTWWCFIAWTKVTMADGSEKNIEDVVVWDELLWQGWVNVVEELYRPLLWDKWLYSINGSKNFVSPEHPFMTTEWWKSFNPELSTKIIWEEVGMLEIWDVLVTEDWYEILKSYGWVSADVETQLYNFKVWWDKTYYANGYLVHNKGWWSRIDPILLTWSCFNVNGWNASIEYWEYLPFYLNVQKLAGHKNNSDSIYVWTGTVTEWSSCWSGWRVALNSMRCHYEIKKWNKPPIASWVVNCLTNDVTNKPMIKKWIRWQNCTYGDCNKPMLSYDPWSGTNYTFKSNVVAIKDFWKNVKEYWEYKISITKIDYLYCDEYNKWKSDHWNWVCQSNITLTQPYTVQKTPSGNLTASTTVLDTFTELDGAETKFSSYLWTISTSDYNSNDKAKDRMDIFINKYEKLAVNVGNGMKKVPWKSIYFISDNKTITDWEFNKPFTIVQADSTKTITVSWNVQYNMMILTRWNIIFKWDCENNQIVKWIFYAWWSLNRSWVNKNDNLENNYWCSRWSLYVKWVLIWNNFNHLMNNSRANLNDWFKTTDKPRAVMDGASVLIEYSPSIFTKWTMPPGAEDFTTALTVYKN